MQNSNILILKESVRKNKGIEIENYYIIYPKTSKISIEFHLFLTFSIYSYKLFSCVFIAFSIILFNKEFCVKENLLSPFVCAVCRNIVECMALNHICRS